MTKNWLSQVGSSLGSIYKRNIDTAWYRISWIKSWYISKSL